MSTLKASTKWFRFHLGLWIALLACQGPLFSGSGPALADDESDQAEDRMLAEENGWVYNDLTKGFAEAKRTGKPLFVVIRCPP